MKLNRFGEDARQQMVDAAKQLYSNGYTTTEIAAKLCVSESTVRSIKKELEKTK